VIDNVFISFTVLSALMSEWSFRISAQRRSQMIKISRSTIVTWLIIAFMLAIAGAIEVSLILDPPTQEEIDDAGRKMLEFYPAF